MIRLDSHRRRRGSHLLFAVETELGQVIAQRLQFDGGLAFVRISDAAGEQFGIIGENVDTFAATRNRNVKLFTIDGGKRF